MFPKSWTRHGHWQDMVNIILGLLLILAPWLLAYVPAAPVDGAEPARDITLAAWHSWAAGGAVVIVAVAALLRTFEWEEWLMGLLGLWVIAAPWLLGFAGVQAAMAAHVVLGALVVVFAAWDIWSVRHMPPTAKA